MTKKDTEKILQELNPEQKEAVTFGDGPILIIAGAGTGKTMVIARRIGWLILSGLVKPEEILALTFTEKAAEEMEERVDKLLPHGYVDLWISTFHAFCQRVLQDEAINIGLAGDFKVLSEPEQWALLRKNLDRLELDYYRPLGNPIKFIRSLVQHFSRAKDEAVTPEEYLKYAQSSALNNDSALSNNLVSVEVRRTQEIANAYQVYQNLLLEENSLDFGDLINYTLKLFKERPLILEKYRQKFKYILVDEFQDTNWAQYELLKMIAAPKNNLTVVFDDEQAIYRWRGASYNNAIQLAEDYPKARKIVLTNNYRSKQNIIDLAYKFIQLNNPNRLEYQLNQPKNRSLIKALKFEKGFSKKMFAQKKGQAEISFIYSQDHHQEIAEVIRKISELRKEKKTSWNNFAILARTNHQANRISSALAQAGLPCQFLASSGLYTKPIILDILAWIQLLDDYHESPALWRVLNLPCFNFTGEDLVNLTHRAQRKGVSLYETLKAARSLKTISEKGLETISQILELIEKHSKIAKESTMQTIFAFLEDSGYLKILKEETAENLANLNWVNQFLKKVEAFEEANTDKSVKNFQNLMKITLEAGDTGTLTPILEGPEAVKVMTVHAAKGLEFRYVFIMGLVDRRFPTIHRRDPIELPEALIKEIIPEGDFHLQEERRLFYVAMTRAMDGLYLTRADDYGGQRKKKASRFLIELGLAEKEPQKLNYGARGAIIEKIKIKTIKEGTDITKLKLPEKFSFTQLVEFATCPLQYKYKHILHIPVRGKASLSFGRTIHDTLYRFFNRWQEMQGQATLFGQDNKKKDTLLLTWKDLLAFYEECWIDDWYLDKQHQEKYKARGREMLKKFYQGLKSRYPRPKHLERNFNFRINGHTIKGKIDRIDLTEDSKGIEIIDYKTGKPKSSKELNLDEKEQLLIYQMAAEAVLKEKPARLTYYFLENNSPCSFLGTPEELEKLKNKILTEIEQIKASSFEPTPSSHKCKFCDYKEICQYRAT